MTTYTRPEERLLLGPGPSNCHPRVLQALSSPTMGHLDAQFMAIMGECMDLMRLVFGSSHPVTIPVSGTGSAGMEASLVNFIEPNDRVVLGVAGLFGERMVDIAQRQGADVVQVKAPWGQAVDMDELEAAVKEAPTKLVGLVHAETSTGVYHDLKPLAELASRHGALSMADTVTSLGGMPVLVDELGLDIVYSGTQKCLSCPPGLAPLTVSPRALEVLHSRKEPVPSWYLDLTMISRYFGKERFYHHTAPVNMIYALRESLMLIEEETLEATWARHAENSRALYAGLGALGLAPLPQPKERLNSLCVVRVPDGIDEAQVRAKLIKNYSMEIGGGLGELKGKVWRIGLMGYNSNVRNVNYCLTALGNELKAQGCNVSVDAALTEAAAHYTIPV